MAENSNPRTPKLCQHRDPYADIGRLENIRALMAYILRQLGAPRICVELTEEQLLDVIGASIR